MEDGYGFGHYNGIKGVKGEYLKHEESGYRCSVIFT